MRALLIGIDCYLPNILPEGVSYPHLSGCVRDVGHVETFLRSRMRLSNGQIRRLTATTGLDGRPAEPRWLWPTYENIVSAIREIAESAPGEQVYVHYSGHGGRSPTAYPELKGAKGLDESIVPVDIGDPRGRYLRDLEIMYLLKTMTDRGIIVTLVLDCCHSGGATRAVRSESVAVRGVEAIDWAQRPPGDVAPREAIIATWHATRALNSRDALPALLPNGRDVVLLAACRPSEVACEFAFEGDQKNGALTYWFLDTLRQSHDLLTFRQLKDRIVVKVHEKFASQTPMLLGPGDRVVFGAELKPLPYSAVVTGIDGAVRAMLSVGLAHGVRIGCTFAVYPPNTVDFATAERRIALATVTSVGAVDSVVTLTEQREEVQVGASAVMVSPTNPRVRRFVGLARRAEGENDKRTLGALAHAIEAKGSGWLELTNTARQVDYWVVEDDHRGLLICDSGGEPIAAADGGEPTIEAVVQRLVHLAKYRAVQELDNADVTSPLMHKLEATFVGQMATFTLGDTPEPRAFEDEGRASISSGQWAVLRIKNTARCILNIVVLDLRPDYSIAQIFPGEAGNSFWPLESGEWIDLPLRGRLPNGLGAGTDLLKIIGTRSTTDFHVLELPPLGEAPRATRRAVEAAPPGTLAHLLGRLANNRQSTRHLDSADGASHGWTIAALELEIHAPPVRPNEQRMSADGGPDVLQVAM